MTSSAAETEPHSPLRTVRVAAVDCGTNTVRLLVADVVLNGQGEAADLRELTREVLVTRLGRGVDRTGEFDPGALQLTLEAIATYAQRCRELEVPQGHVRLIATSATRDAGNREEFFAGATAFLGVAPEVASGDEEAHLSFTGATSVHRAELDADAPVLVVDIGGGSTELVLGTTSAGVQAAVSLDMGSVRLTERYFRTDPPTAGELTQARAQVRTLLDQAGQQVPLGEARAVIGLAGSVSTLTAHALDLTAYDRTAVNGAHLSMTQWYRAAEEMIASSRAEREAMGFLHPGRIDVIGAGVLIWQEVLSRIERDTAAQGHRVGGATTSEHDILDGIALSIARAVQG